MKVSLTEEFNEILKSLDSLSQDKVELFVKKIAVLFQKIHHKAEFGTKEEQKEAFEFAAQIPKSFNKLQAKLAQNPVIDASQFQHLLSFIEEDVTVLSQRRPSDGIQIKKAGAKARRKKKDVKKV